MALSKAEAIALLSREVPVSAEPVLDEDDLEDLVAFMAVPDEDERPPSDEEWEPTYSRRRLPYAAALAFERKASRVANLVDVNGDGGVINAGDLHRQLIKMARRFRARCAGSVSVGS
jgi:hypothetical protein